MKNIIKWISTIPISVLGYFLGGFDSMMITLLIFMTLDYLTGVMVAIKKKKVNSKIGFEGILKKILILIMVGMANQLGNTINVDGIRYLVIAFYLANEGISIIENAGKFGVPIPEKLKDILEQLKEKGSEKDESK